MHELSGCTAVISSARDTSRPMLKSCIASSFHGKYLTHRLRACGAESVSAACPQLNLTPCGFHAQQVRGVVQHAICVTRHERFTCGRRLHSRRRVATAAATSAAETWPDGARDAPEPQGTPLIQDIFGGVHAVTDSCFDGCFKSQCYHDCYCHICSIPANHHGELFTMNTLRILCCTT